MDDSAGKKEITLKRLSAFKFAVEVSSLEPASELPLRESVIRRAPPSTGTQAKSEICLIAHQVLYRIVETLLWKLIGEKKLIDFCGYPRASTCILLRKVLYLSDTRPSPTTQVWSECNGSIECFMGQVRRLLDMFAPTDDLWKGFGWSGLQEEAILRKIYIEELSPNIRSYNLPKDNRGLQLINEIDRLLDWERRGYYAVSSTNQYKYSGERTCGVQTTSNNLKKHGGSRVMWRRLGPYQYQQNYFIHNNKRPLQNAPSGAETHPDFMSRRLGIYESNRGDSGPQGYHVANPRFHRQRLPHLDYEYGTT